MTPDIILPLKIATLVGLIAIVGINAILSPAGIFKIAFFKTENRLDKIGGILIWLYIVFVLYIFF